MWIAVPLLCSAPLFPSNHWIAYWLFHVVSSLFLCPALCGLCGWKNPRNTCHFGIHRSKQVAGWWYTYPSEKWWSSSVVHLIPNRWKNKSPIWKVIKVMFQTTNKKIGEDPRFPTRSSPESPFWPRPQTSLRLRLVGCGVHTAVTARSRFLKMSWKHMETDWLV